MFNVTDFFCRLLLHHYQPPRSVHLLLRLLLLVLLLLHNHTRCHHPPVHYWHPCGSLQVSVIPHIFNWIKHFLFRYEVEKVLVAAMRQSMR